MIEGKSTDLLTVTQCHTLYQSVYTHYTQPHHCVKEPYYFFRISVLLSVLCDQQPQLVRPGIITIYCGLAGVGILESGPEREITAIEGKSPSAIVGPPLEAISILSAWYILKEFRPPQISE